MGGGRHINRKLKMVLSPMNKQVERGPRGRVLCASYIVKKGVGEA